MEARLVLAIQVSKSLQPVIERSAEEVAASNAGAVERSRGSSMAGGVGSGVRGGAGSSGGAGGTAGGGAGVGDYDPDAPDEEAGVATQENIPGVDAAARAVTNGVPGMPSDADAGGSFDGEGPIWPDEIAESGMRAEAVSRGETLSSKAAREAAEAAAEAAAEKRNLPKLDDLMKQIPPDIMDALEDLFRVKFVKVQRSPKKFLKGQGGLSTRAERGRE